MPQYPPAQPSPEELQKMLSNEVPGMLAQLGRQPLPAEFTAPLAAQGPNPFGPQPKGGELTSPKMLEAMDFQRQVVEMMDRLTGEIAAGRMTADEAHSALKAAGNGPEIKMGGSDPSNPHTDRDRRKLRIGETSEGDVYTGDIRKKKPGR